MDDVYVEVEFVAHGPIVEAPLTDLQSFSLYLGCDTDTSTWDEATWGAYREFLQQPKSS